MLVTNEPGQEIGGAATSVKRTFTTQFAVFSCASVAENATWRVHDPAAPRNGHHGKTAENKLVALTAAVDGPLSKPVIVKGSGLLSDAVGRLPLLLACDCRAKGEEGSCVNDTKTSLHDHSGSFTSLKQLGPSQPEIAVLH
jgi:hypothetical protein